MSETPYVPWKQVREKLDKVAEAVALMERGEYQFEDGKQHFTTEDGMQVPRVIKNEAMRYGGYKGPSRNAWSHIFSEGGTWRPYFLERLRWHRQRLAGGFRQQLAELTEDGSALRDLSAAAYEVIMQQLKDPEAYKKIKPDTVAKIYLESTKLEAAVKGDVDTKRHHPISAPQVMNVINLPESVAAYVQEKRDVMEGELVAESD